MNAASGVLRDERTEVVENASYRLAYLFITYALLLDVMYRSMVRRESSWELLAIVIVAGAISTVYQGWQRILNRQSLKVFAITFVAAGVVGACVAAMRYLG
jgi:hypothetical protein